MIRPLVAALFARAAAEQLRVAAMGDSNTAGGAGGMDEFTESYPAQLSVLLGGDEWDVRNFGKGGRTVVDTQGRAYRDARAYEEALTWGDDGFEVLIICLGTNDVRFPCVIGNQSLAQLRSPRAGNPRERGLSRARLLGRFRDIY